MNDLENAVTWNGTGTQLREILAGLLENEGRVGDAIKVLKESTVADSNAWVPLIAVSLRNGRKQPADEAKLHAKRSLQIASPSNRRPHPTTSTRHGSGC